MAKQERKRLKSCSFSEGYIWHLSSLVSLVTLPCIPTVSSHTALHPHCPHSRCPEVPLPPSQCPEVPTVSSHTVPTGPSTVPCIHTAIPTVSSHIVPTAPSSIALQFPLLPFGLFQVVTAVSRKSYYLVHGDSTIVK